MQRRMQNKMDAGNIQWFLGTSVSEYDNIRVNSHLDLVRCSWKLPIK